MVCGSVIAWMVVWLRMMLFSCLGLSVLLLITGIVVALVVVNSVG